MHPLYRKADLVVQEVDDEILVYDLRTHRAKCLNSMSARVWRLCDGTMSVEDIADALSADSRYRIPVEVVSLALDQLWEEELLAVQDTREVLQGVSRREAFRRAGLATAVALPLISAITAPIAAQAQSGPLACVPTGGGCTCNVVNSGRKGQECTPSVPCATDCRCVHANNGNNFTGDCVV